MRKVIYISGGQRSGKSSFAQKTAEMMSDNPVYLATARCWDEEFGKRIERHRQERGSRWTNIEEEKNISGIDLSGRVILMDCVTLWLTNIFHDNNYQVRESLEWAKKEWDSFISGENIIIVVSNEIGMGVIPAERSARRFADLQGWMNQYIADSAHEVYIMFSGIPLKVK